MICCMASSIFMEEKNPYKATNLKMGVKDIKIDEIVKNRRKLIISRGRISTE